MRTFEKKQNHRKLNYLSRLPDKIIMRQTSPALLVFGKHKEVSTCIKCAETPCILAGNFSVNEIDIGFSADSSSNLCPVKAIQWDKNINAPRVNADTCIGCGLCAARCPVGAIYATSKNRFIVETRARTNYITEREYSPAERKKQTSQIKELLCTKKEGSIKQEKDREILILQEKLQGLPPLAQNQFVKNLLRALQCRSFVRRTGDNSFRMDGLISFNIGKIEGPLEIEFGDDCLSAIRLILDDISVLHSRYRLEKTQQKPLVVFHHMPNVRQGYWQVCQDISNVTGIKVKTLTVMALILLMWNLKRLEDCYGLFYLDSNLNNLLPFLEKAIGRKLEIKKSASGILFPVK